MLKKATSEAKRILLLALLTLGPAINAALATDGPPIILQEPTAQAAEAGTSVTLEVVATNTPTLSYQWFKDGVAVSNATEAILAFNPVSLSDAAVYFVVVSNDLGSATSSNVVLAVRPPGAPIIRVNGELAADSVTTVGSAIITIEGGFTNGVIYYTLDGSTPDSISSPVYTDPIVTSNSIVVRALGQNADTLDTAEAPALTVNITPVYTLTLTVSGNGVAAVDPPDGPYTNNSIVSVTATADAGWVFDHWSGDVDDTNNPISLIINAPKMVQANFVQLFSLTATTAGGGSLNLIPDQEFYPSNSVVTVSATVSNGWTFLEWQGDLIDTNNPLFVTVAGPLNLSAVFGTTLFTTVIGSGTVSSDTTNPIPYGAVATLTATPNAGWEFDHWSGDAGGSDNPISITVTTPMSVQAVFTQLSYPVTATTPGGGTISMNPPTGPYPGNSVVRIQAIPRAGWKFLNWQGDASGTDNPLSLTVNGPVTLSAVFGTTFQTQAVGPGSGIVELNSPQPIPYGTTVRATAVPDYGSYFVRWFGALSSSNNPADFLVVSNVPIQAFFGGLPFGTVPLSVGITALEDSTVQLSWPGSAYYYTLETSTGLPPVWTALDHGLQTRVGPTVYVSLPATNTQQFFRVKASLGAPICQYAIFYNGLLEFSTCSTMTINGRVHCNTNIFVGAGGSASLTFNALVTAVGTISAPTNNGQGWGNPTNFNSSWRTTFAALPAGYATNVAVVHPLVSLINPHTLIDMPTTPDDWTNMTGLLRVYNQAQVVLLVSNTTVTTLIRQAPAGLVPAADPSGYTNVYTTNPGILASNLPFLSLTNMFYDGREKTTNITTQIDIGQYARWIGTNAQIVGSADVAGKFPLGTPIYPTILYVADNRTAGPGRLAVLRLSNGTAPPVNGNHGFTLATPNPLYVWGNYNQTNASLLGTTNTSSGTVPCAFLSDALTLLSSNWSDSVSFGVYSNLSWNASASDTVNAAIITGLVPTTGTDALHFSGGVHNLPRLLEDWSSSTLWLNTSIVVLYNSARATNQFLNPGPYYNPPTRRFSYDQNFSIPNGMPPGIPLIVPP